MEIRDGRSPYGERGLKCRDLGERFNGVGSLSLRRAWIEICSSSSRHRRTRGRSPYGERGLK